MWTDINAKTNCKMFDPLMRHYQRLYNIKPSAEIASTFGNSTKSPKKHKTANQIYSSGRPSRPHSSIVYSANYRNTPNHVPDNNNNLNERLTNFQHGINPGNLYSKNLSFSTNNLNYGLNTNPDQALLLPTQSGSNAEVI